MVFATRRASRPARRRCGATSRWPIAKIFGVRWMRLSWNLTNSKTRSKMASRKMLKKSLRRQKRAATIGARVQLQLRRNNGASRSHRNRSARQTRACGDHRARLEEYHEPRVDPRRARGRRSHAHRRAVERGHADHGGMFAEIGI